MVEGLAEKLSTNGVVNLGLLCLLILLTYTIHKDNKMKS